jgi:hypothetical protein
MEELNVDIRMLLKLIFKCSQLDDRQAVMFVTKTSKFLYIIKL